MTLPAVLLLANAAATWFMAGLIWFVQVVHYPQFDGVGDGGWSGYHRRHTRSTTLVVGPPMLVEAATSLALLFPRLRPPFLSASVALVGFTMVVLLWLSTALIQVPRHDLLAHGFDPRAHRVLCRSNWLRTALWTARGVLMGYALSLAVRG